MTKKVLYYGIIPLGRPPDSPGGLARRTISDVGFTDESFRRDFTWEHTAAIVSWEHADGHELVKVSAEQAEQLMERFRREWAES